MERSSLLTVPFFILKSLVVQMLAGAIVVIAWRWIPYIPVVLTIASLAAFASARFVGLPTSWQLLNMIVPWATAATLALDIPGVVYLTPLCLAVAIYAPALLTRVPYYPTSRPAYALILAELPTDRPFTFIDVGCGFGDLLIFLAEHRPNGRFQGIELGPLPLLVARTKAFLRGQKNLAISCRDMWRTDFANFDYVYTFLSPAAMERIWEKVSTEMRPGSTFITNSFPVPHEADEELAIRDERNGKLYVHRN
jgi:SAM-dependent methyltransferase